MSDPGRSIKTIAIIGGTGKEGKGLAFRWAKAGYHVLIGSRQVEKAQAAANEIREMAGGTADVQGVENQSAAEKADVVVLTVPYSAHRATLEAIKPYLTEKILVDVTVPLVPPKVAHVHMPPAGSATQEAVEILGEGYEVVAAFQNISYGHLIFGGDLACDVLVTGTSKAAREKVIELVQAAGLEGYDAGPVENSMVIEGLTSILIGINKKYGVQSAGIQITGVPRKTRSDT